MTELRESELAEIYEEVINSGCLGNSSRRQNLFKYLWENTNSNQIEKITQFSIAIDVLNRSESFDSGSDGIVRTEVGRLRRALDTFSAKSPYFSVRISKGSYGLIVSKKTKLVHMKKNIFFAASSILVLGLMFSALYINANKPNYNYTDTCSSNSNTPSIVVKQKANNSQEDNFTLTTIQEVLKQNTHLKLDNVICQNPTAPQYILEFYSVQKDTQHTLIITVKGAEEISSLAFLNVTVSTEQSDFYETLFFEIASNLNDIVKPYGLLTRNAIHNEWNNRVARDHFSCLVKMYDYYDSETKEEYNDVHTCLEDAVIDIRAPLDIRGGLAASYLEQAKDDRKPTVNEPWETVGEILSNNSGVINRSVELMIAKITFEADNPNYTPDKLDNALLTAESAFNSNPQVIVTASGYSGVKLGDWGRAERLATRAKLLTKQRDQSIYSIDAFNFIMSSNSTLSHQNCFKFYSENSIIANITVKACAIKSDNKVWLTKADESLNRLGFKSVEQQIAYLDGRNWHPSLVNAITKLLRSGRLKL